VGKIYKPQLRCDAAVREVTRLLRQMDLPQAAVQAREGGPRGMTVEVSGVPAHAAAAVEQALARYLFEARVQPG
jgi:fatty-acyl-CoA synthase